MHNEERNTQSETPWKRLDWCTWGRRIFITGTFQWPCRHGAKRLNSHQRKLFQMEVLSKQGPSTDEGLWLSGMSKGNYLAGRALRWNAFIQTRVRLGNIIYTAQWDGSKLKAQCSALLEKACMKSNDRGLYVSLGINSSILGPNRS